MGYDQNKHDEDEILDLFGNRKHKDMQAIHTIWEFVGMAGSVIWSVLKMSFYGIGELTKIVARFKIMDKLTKIEKVKEIFVMSVIIVVGLLSLYLAKYLNGWVVIPYIVVLFSFGLKYHWRVEDIKKKFITINFIDRQRNIPELISYIPNGEYKEYIFKSFNAESEWVNRVEDLEFIFQKKIYFIGAMPDYQIKVIFVSQETFDKLMEKPKQEVIDHKDTTLSLKKRLQGTFEYLGLDIMHITVMYQSQYGEVLYFNSGETLTKLDTYLKEIKHRMHIDNMILATSNIDEYDYMLKIIMKVEIIKFLDIYQEVKDRLNNMTIPVLLGMALTTGEIRLLEYTGYYNSITAGTVRSGKTTFMRNMLLMSLLAHKNVSYIVIDPKGDMKMFKEFNNVLYLHDEIEKIIMTLEFMVKEMENRNKLFTNSGVEFCDTIEKYNKIKGNKMPYVYFIFEELFDLFSMAGEQRAIIEKLMQRLAQKAPSVGFKMWLSTQKPTNKTVGDLTKALCPTRYCFAVSNMQESRNILDNNDGIMINQAGSFIFKHNEQETFQNPYLSDIEFTKVIKMLREQEQTSKVN